jgi:hypothetical protein
MYTLCKIGQIVTSPGSFPSSPKLKITPNAVPSGADVVNGPPANLIAGCYGHPPVPFFCALRAFARSISLRVTLFPNPKCQSTSLKVHRTTGATVRVIPFPYPMRGRDWTLQRELEPVRNLFPFEAQPV